MAVPCHGPQAPARQADHPSAGKCCGDRRGAVGRVSPAAGHCSCCWTWQSWPAVRGFGGGAASPWLLGIRAGAAVLVYCLGSALHPVCWAHGVAITLPISPWVHAELKSAETQRKRSWGVPPHPHRTELHPTHHLVLVAQEAQGVLVDLVFHQHPVGPTHVQGSPALQ